MMVLQWRKTLLIYQAAEIQPYECAVGVTSSDITMEENPAYQSVDTTESQTEEPEYL